MTGYQLLPALAKDDRDRLAASIAERGVEIPIVLDENGEIIDGHHRKQIADELGIRCPVIVKDDLSEHEKRLLAVELNLARRQLTEFQKVELGRLIEKDVAERAAARERAGKRVADPMDKCPQGTGTTRDEVARTVGIGSGRTYERAKQVIEAVEKEPDGPVLLEQAKAGELDIPDLRQRMKVRIQERAKKETVDANQTGARILQVVGDPEGNQARATVRRQFSDGLVALSALTGLDPAAIADSISQDTAYRFGLMIPDIKQWLDSVHAELHRGVRLVSGGTPR